MPDIQIKREDVMKPLQRLVLLDSSVAKVVLVQLVLSIGGNEENWGERVATHLSGEETLDAYTAKLKNQIVQALQQSGTASADVVESLLGIAQNFGMVLPASAVVSAGNRSSNYYTSIQVLERQALSVSSPSLPAAQISIGRGGKKRGAGVLVGHKRQDNVFSDSDWHNLSRLYSRLEEHDIVRGLCEKFSKQQRTREALHFELLGDFDHAISLYNDLRTRFDNGEFADHETGELEVDLWDEGIRDCLEGLQLWDQLRDWVKSELEITDDIRESGSIKIWEPDQRKELGLYLRCLIGKAGQEAFSVQERGDVESAATMSRIVFDNLFDPSGKLEMKRQALESDFVPEAALGLLLDKKQLKDNRFEIVKTGKDLVHKGYHKFLEKWSYSGSIGAVVKKKMLRSVQNLVELEEFFELSSSMQPSVENCKALLTSWDRRLPLKEIDDSNQWTQILSGRLALLPQIKAPKIQAALDSSISATYLALANLARRRGNLTAALAWIEKGEAVYGKKNLLLHIGRLKLQRKMRLWPVEMHNETSWSTESPLNFARLLTVQAELLTSNSEQLAEVQKKYMKAIEIIQALPALPQLGLGPKMGSIFMKYANFCNQQVQISENDDMYPKAVVENMLHAMELGNCKARAHFPRILEITRLFPGTRGAFLERSSLVPVRSILHWLPQIFSELSCAQKRKDRDSSFQDSMIVLLQRFALDFPQATYLASRVVMNEKPGDKKNLSLIYKPGFDSKMIDVFERFCRSLQHLQEPSIQLMDFAKSPDAEGYKQVFEDCLNHTNKKLGQSRQDFAKQMVAIGVVKMVDQGGKLADKVDWKKVEELIKKNEKQKPSKQQLLQFSPELANFEGGSIHGEQLVVPGQTYDCEYASKEQEGIKIISYDPSLLMLTSMRKPKRLIMRGSDGKEYWWLIKNGEDLRQDERVQQVFRAMNQVLVGDARCSQARLSIVTYSVVPISKSAGLIEWVQKTKPMADILDEYDGFLAIRKEAEEKYTEIYKTFDDYQSALKSETGRSDRIDTFSEICKLIPSQVLRSGILKLACNAKVVLPIFL